MSNPQVQPRPLHPQDSRPHPPEGRWRTSLNTRRLEANLARAPCPPGELGPDEHCPWGSETSLQAEDGHASGDRAGELEVTAPGSGWEGGRPVFSLSCTPLGLQRSLGGLGKKRETK